MDDSEPKSAEQSGLARLRSHARLLIVIAVLLLLYTLGGFLLVPHVARNAIIGYVQKNMGGRHASIGELKFNPFTLTVEIHRFALSEANDSPIASFDLLRVGASLTASLMHRAWTLSEVRLEQPQVRALIDRDGTLNLARLAPATGEKAEKPARPDSDKSLPALRINTLGVHGGSVQFEDHSRAEPFSTTLRPIEFDLTDFRTARDFENKYRFSAQSSAGERLDWAGQFTLQPLGSNGEFTIGQLKALTIADYLQNALPFSLVSGSLDIQGNYQFTATPAIALSLTLPAIKVHSLGINPGGATSSGAAPWVSLPELDVNNTSVSLSDRRVTIGQILLQHAAIQLWRNADGSLNLQQLAGAQKAAASAPATTPPAASTAPAWNVALEKLELQDANIAVEDRSVKPAFKTQLGAIGLTVANYSSAGTAPLNIDLHMQIGQGGQLQTAGTVMLSSMNSALELTLTGLDLPALQPYVAQSTDLTIYRGKLGVKGHITYAGAPARGQPKLQLALGINVADLATRDNFLNEDLISWRSLQIDGMRYQMAPDALRIEHIAVGAPYGRVVIGAKGGLNVAQILRPARAQGAAGGADPSAATGDAAPAAAPPVSKSGARKSKSAGSPAKVVDTAPPKKPGMPMSIARIDIQDGVTNFTDRSVQPTFSTAIYGLKGSVVGLSSDPASRATVSLEGSVDRYAPVSIKGKVNVLSAATFTDIAISFSNIELPTFNPYSGKFAGYNIAQGKLTTEMQYHVENRKLEAKHHIVVDQLEFGAATESKQAVPLPIKLAVSLLKDRNGVIDLELPVGGSLDDPTFRVGPIIWKVFVNLIEKVVMAPFAALGKLFGGGAELSYVDFPAGASVLGADQTQKLSQLASALVERPQVKLNVPLHTQADDDDAALERVALDQALQATTGASAAEAGKSRSQKTKGSAQAGSDATATAAARLPALVALYRTQFKSDPEYPPETAGGADPEADKLAWLQQQLLPQFSPSQADRDALGMARAQAVQSAVLANAEVKPDRVFLVNQVSGGGADGKVRMELKLE